MGQEQEQVPVQGQEPGYRRARVVAVVGPVRAQGLARERGLAQVRGLARQLHVGPRKG